MQNKETVMAISLGSLAKQAREEICKLTGLDFSSVVAIMKDAKEWRVSIEVVEKHTIPAALDLLGIYDIHFDENGKLLNFERKGMRTRSSQDITYDSNI